MKQLIFVSNLCGGGGSTALPAVNLDSGGLSGLSVMMRRFGSLSSVGLRQLPTSSAPTSQGLWATGSATEEEAGQELVVSGKAEYTAREMLVKHWQLCLARQAS